MKIPSRHLLNALRRPFAYTCPACQLRQQRPSKVSHQNAAPQRHLQTKPHSELTTSSSKDSTIVPFRKQLKAERTALKQLAKAQTSGTNRTNNIGEEDFRLSKWELTVGIEIHAELNTSCKLFSPASTSINDAPNTHVSVFDAAVPGTQPQFQKATLLPALRAALAFQCNISRRSSWDRKHYFWWDQPNGYQITQYYEPFARNGKITLYEYDDIDPTDFPQVEIGIKQIQMEQDTAKTILQPPSTHLLDFNRVSHPLIEIITLPQIHSPKTAAAVVRKIQSILKAVDANVTGMEMGGLRADVNVSIRRNDEAGTLSYAGISGLGQRTEIKNLSSFKAVEDAIVAERNRQIALIEGGGSVEGETRGFTLGSSETRRLRGKEGEVDYRYMPDPDLPPLLIGDDLIEHLRATLPALPDDTVALLTQDADYSMSLTDAKALLGLDDGDRLDYYFDVVANLHSLSTTASSSGEVSAFLDEELRAEMGRTASNWTIHELGALLASRETPFSVNLVPAASLAEVIHHVRAGEITLPSAKTLVAHMLDTRISADTATAEASSRTDARNGKGGMAEAGIVDGVPTEVQSLIDALGLRMKKMSAADYTALAQRVLRENEEMAAKLRADVAALASFQDTKAQAKAQAKLRGKVMYFVGQMVRTGERGSVQPKLAEEAVRRILFSDS